MSNKNLLYNCDNSFDRPRKIINPKTLRHLPAGFICIFTSVGLFIMKVFMPLGVLSNKILKNDTILVSYRLSFKRKYRTKLNWLHFFFPKEKLDPVAFQLFSYQFSDCRANKDILYHCRRPLNPNLSGISTGIKHQIFEHTLHFKATRET